MGRAVKNKGKRISIWNWMGTLFLCCIPGVNLIALILFIVFGKTASKRGFATAALLLMLLFAVTVTFLSLFEIAGLLHAFSMSQIGRQTNLVSMFLAGLRACKKALHPKNWLLLLFILVLFPLLKVFPLAGSTFKLVLPGFVNQTIAYTKTLRIVYWAFYLSLIAFLTIYIFSVNIFVLQKSDFRKARRLMQGMS